MRQNAKFKMQYIQSRAARLITSANYDIRLTDIFDNLGWEALDARRKQLKLVVMYFN